MILPAILFLFTCTTSLPIRVFLSSATPNLTSDILYDMSEINRDFHVLRVTSEQDLFVTDSRVVIDYLFNSTLSIVLESLCANDKRYFAMWRRSEGIPYLEQFTTFVKRLSWSKVAIVSDSQTENRKSSAYLTETYPFEFAIAAVLPTSSSFNLCNQFVGHTIKPRGVSFVAVFTDEITAYNLLSAFEAHKMNRVGYGFILSQEASLYRYVAPPTVKLHSSGVVIVAGPASEATSRLEYQQRLIAGAIDALLNDGTDSKPEYYLYSVSSFVLQVVCSNSSQELMDSALLFPGDSTEIPHHSTAEIQTSVNYDAKEPDSSIIPISHTVMRGFQVAFEEVNKRHDLIPDYSMKDNSVDFAGVTFDFNVSRSRVAQNMGKVGVIYMSLPLSQTVVGMFNVFQSLNLTVPITGSSFDSDLSDKQRFPLYVRPRVSNLYVLNIVSMTILSFGWKRLAVLYQNDNGECENSYATFLILASEYRINITNSVRNRRMPGTLNSTSANFVNDSLDEIIASDTQVILMLSNFHYLVLDILYEKGVREEYEILLITGLTDGFYRGSGLKGRRTVSKGALMFFPKLFLGSTGQRVLSELIRYDNSTYVSNTCLYYDAAMLYFHATDFLLEHGMDFEDPHLLVSTMRKTRFRGCSGFVRIDSSSNDRASAEIAILNFRYDSENDTYEIRVIGSYNPYIAEPFQFKKKDIQWPNGEDSFSDSKPKYRHCSFLANRVRTVFVGKALGAAICVLFSICVLLLTVILQKKVRRGIMYPLIQKETISKEDIMCLFAAFLDFIAYLSVGPRITPLSSSVYATFAFDEMVQVESETYWERLHLIIGITAFLILLYIIRIIRTHRYSFCDTLNSCGNFIAPLITKVVFIPTMMVYFKLFQCTKSLSVNISDSFMDIDCSTTCWSGTHLRYALTGGALTLSYVLLSVLHRFVWANRQINLHITTNLSAVAIQIYAQMILVVSFVVLSEEHPVVHGALFIGVMSAYAVFVAVIGEYNYARLNMWATICNIAVILLSVAAFASLYIGYQLYIALVLAGSYCVLIAVGLTLQWTIPKLESKLKREKGKDITNLLEFAFTGGGRANAALRRHYTVNHLQVESEQTFSLYI